MSNDDDTCALLQLIADRIGETNQHLHETNRRLDETKEELKAEIRETNVRIDQTNTRLDQTRTELSARIDQTRTELSARIDQTNIRIDQTNIRIDQTRSDLSARIDFVANGLVVLNTTVTDFTAEMRTGFAELDHRIDGTNERLDGVLHILGEHHGSLGARVVRIEQHLKL
jgi:chromosome segregation ATPase